MTSSDHATALVGVAARAIGRAGLAHAYGHCSVRCDAEHFLVSPAKPLGMVCPDDPPIHTLFEAASTMNIVDVLTEQADANGDRAALMGETLQRVYDWSPSQAARLEGGT